jgi:hypothetical protein
MPGAFRRLGSNWGATTSWLDEGFFEGVTFAPPEVNRGQGEGRFPLSWNQGLIYAEMEQTIWGWADVQW